MSYSPEEMDWIEAEWAFHLHGRQAFLSREDFQQLLDWGARDVPADLLVNAMETYFQRRAKRPHARTFVALSNLEKDVQKALKLRQALEKAGQEGGGTSVATDKAAAKGWARVKEPLRGDPRARSAFEAWKRLAAGAPAPDDPGFLDHFDAERRAFRDFLNLAEAALGPRKEALTRELEGRLEEARIPKAGPVWARAWKHHWARLVCEAWGVEGEGQG